jgi:tetratricopeptide (TPR) repeat protein
MKLEHLLFTACAVCLAACASSGVVVVRTMPEGSNVFVIDPKSGQGALIGQSPMSFRRQERTTKGSDVIQLRIEKDGFQSKTPSVAAFGGGTTYLDVELAPVVVAKGEIRDSFEKVRAHMSNTQRLVVTNRYTEALGEAEKVIELDPKNVEAYAAKGSILFLMKDTEGARTAWSKALELNPGYESVRNSLIELNMESSERRPAGEGRK